MAEGSTENPKTIDEFNGLRKTRKAKSKSKGKYLSFMQFKGLIEKRLIFAKRKYFLHITMVS